jgi:hypothetical protein
MQSFANRAPWVVALVLASACGDSAGTSLSGGGGSGGSVAFPPALPALPPPASAETETFVTSGACAQCHLAAEGDELRDADGRDVSPVRLWRASMMGLAARDPFYLAVFQKDREERPAVTEKVDALCTRCHAPAASVTLAKAGKALGFDDMVSGTAPEAALGRDGVTCSLCHQITSEGLGSEASFSGGFQVGTSREMFGPHANPVVDPMEFFVSYTPTQADHVSESALCATCHTVVVRPMDAAGKPGERDVYEQAPYFEWQNSDYNDEAGGPTPRTCASCHVPPRDEDGDSIQTVLATFDAPLSARAPFGRHVFYGGNAYMLRLFADSQAWSQTGVDAADLEAAALRTEGHVQEAASVSFVDVSRTSSELSLGVVVKSYAGHKLPTGYPTRRMWLRLRVKDGASTVFASGEIDARGALIGASGQRLDPAGVVLPHKREITSADDVQVWEAVLVDDDGKPTNSALGANHYAKDDRILPAGWSSSHPRASTVGPVGVGGDDDFLPGSDGVHYRVPLSTSAPLSITVELLYQSIPPAVIDAMSEVPLPAAVRFSEIAAGRAPEPIVVASTEWALDPP